MIDSDFKKALEEAWQKISSIAIVEIDNTFSQNKKTQQQDEMLQNMPEQKNTENQMQQMQRKRTPQYNENILFSLENDLPRDVLWKIK